MDLGSVKRNISARKYKSIPDAADDIRLVWANCMTYNQDGSDFFFWLKTWVKSLRKNIRK